MIAATDNFLCRNPAAKVIQKAAQEGGVWDALIAMYSLFIKYAEQRDRMEGALLKSQILNS